MVEDAQIGDRACLHPRHGCSCWCRDLLCGTALFGFLAPGPYRLTLCRGGERLCLEVELPPGGNVVLCCTFSEGRCRWRQDLFHYSFNTL